MTPAIRCVILIGTPPGYEALCRLLPDGSRVLNALPCHHSIGFALKGDPNDHVALAATLREVADMLEAPTLPDPDIL